MKKNWNIKSSIIIPAISILFAGFFFFSCSHSEDGTSFLTLLDKVDVSIRTGQTSDALKLLKKASRSAYSSYARIGVYRRFMTLGEKNLAEKTLVQGLKKIPENPELTAVYGQFLLRQDRVPQAVKVTKCLEGTRYGSIYSESVLRSAAESDYLSIDYIPVYQDAYNATKNGKWLVNAALPFLRKGDYAGAAALQDSIDCGNNNFWALVQYDAGNFDLAIDNVTEAQKTSINKSNAALASDAYVQLGDFDSAEKERARLIALSQLEYDIELPPLLVVNSAIWSYNARNYSRAYDLLTTLIMRNPENIPALLTYGKFAMLDSVPDEKDELETYLRQTDLRSLSMIRSDERPRFLMSDALFRIDSYLDLQKKAGLECSDELLVEKLALYLKSNESLPVNSLESEIWKTLEKNELGRDLYPPMLVSFAVSKLLDLNKTEDARNLFTRYLDARYKLKGDDEGKVKEPVYDVFGGEKRYPAPLVPDFVIKAAFGDRAANYAGTMENWEIETAAYFTLLDGNIDASRRLYEYVLFETGGVKNLQKGEAVIAMSPLSQVASAMNLAMIYSATGEPKKALSLYGLASGRTRNKNLKSKILYRTALVQKDLNNINGALLSLDYAISLDPLNADARLLKKQLK